MKKAFLNGIKDKCLFADDGITIFSHTLLKRTFFPYGSIKSISIGMLNMLEVRAHDGTYASFDAGKKYKKEIKELLTFVNRQNSTAKYSSPIVVDVSKEDITFSKDSNAIIDYFGLMCNDGSQMIAQAVPNIIASMDNDEEIIHAFDCTNLEINKSGKIDANWPLVLITNKRLYYAGYDFVFPKSGAITGVIELRDTHAISSSDTSITNIMRHSYVQFETKNDDYKFSTGLDTPMIRAKLEAAVKIAKDNSSVQAVAQTFLSAADEIKKFKELLDMGIITQEEFDAKKKQLLGL